MENLWSACGAAGQQTLTSLAHKPTAVLRRHLPVHVVPGPAVQPGLEAPVQASVDTLLGLK
jgi:hypothetical protein